MPRELIAAVSDSRRDEAITLLGQADVIPLDAVQARELSNLNNPDAILQSLIEELEVKIEVLRSSLAEGGRPPRDWQVVETLTEEAGDYRAWRHRLSPYLIKAVSLNTEGLGFHGTLVSNTLFLDQITPIVEPVPMRKIPVVGFLPLKPDKVYMTFTTFQ